MLDFDLLAAQVDWKPKLLGSGQVSTVRGSLVGATLPLAAIGDLCSIERRNAAPIPAQVVAFANGLSWLAPFGAVHGIAQGAAVHSRGSRPCAEIQGDARGRILDALGKDLTPVLNNEMLEKIRYPVFREPPPPLSRLPIRKQLHTGVRAIDTFCPIGYGQRLGIFAGAGVGKSTLLGMIARHADVDVCVIALVGERGREVQEFIQECLGEQGLSRSVVIVATSDESPLRRLIAPQTATSIAEHYRAQGLRVLLLVDSLTRTARAIREVELAAGEPPVRQGYTSGVYTELPRLLERAGNDDSGSITALYTVLTTGEQDPDPLADEIKSILDGHLVLSQQVQLEGIRPAIDILRSVSRLREKLQSEETQASAEHLLTAAGRIRRDRDIVLLGGTPDSALRAALHVEPGLKRFLSQRPVDYTHPKELRPMLEELSRGYLDALKQFSQA